MLYFATVWGLRWVKCSKALKSFIVDIILSILLLQVTIAHKVHHTWYRVVWVHTSIWLVEHQLMIVYHVTPVCSVTTPALQLQVCVHFFFCGLNFVFLIYVSRIQIVSEICLFYYLTIHLQLRGVYFQKFNPLLFELTSDKNQSKTQRRSGLSTK